MAVHSCLLFYFFILFFFFFKDFIYLFDRQRSQVGREAGREREEEAGSLLSREPDAGLDPKTLGSWPEPKAEALTHWATQVPQRFFSFSFEIIPNSLKSFTKRGAPGWLSGLSLCLQLRSWSQGSWDRVPHRALCSAGSLLIPRPLCLPLCLLVISVCQINK